ncbi:MAG: alpha-ketoglutarate-dependent dioxygenase AlkB [Bacteroidia bacterium]|nr:alpha-ketoglutarate-dependent dioxygenase AlkB [Bacteroidia bacterium]NNK61148.1 alpha-ketoglutarate-dependent dioxygenase AlkB [Flavobacteriaceae bacterium]RZW42905.1 MAG: alpha-ketoglutarate-dependent dioxygenase AlkB [Flavobacteriaceae bacterium]
MSNHIVYNLNLPDADVYYCAQFFSSKVSLALFEKLNATIAWQQDHIKLFGKTYAQPRLTALYANNSNPYSYSNITMYPRAFTEELQFCKSEIEKIVDVNFTSCLLNLYRHGQDSNGWHADNEKELGDAPVIASLSLGAERMFHMKHRKDSKLKHKIKLENGSLLIMKGSTQTNWLHQVPKTKKVIGPRINMTFRVIK